MILPALTEATAPVFRPIKYALFPPLGLAALAGHLPDDWDVTIVDEHVMPAVPTDAPPEPRPDLVVIQVYITNAHRSYELADHFRRHGVRVLLGGLHVTSLPDEAAAHADVLFLGPGDATFPAFLDDLRHDTPKQRYDSRHFPRTLDAIPPARRDLIDRRRYFVPNSIVVTRGCPHGCDFCYKNAFFAGGREFYTERVDRALAEIDRLPGRHLYFLDDHLLGHRRFARELFEGMRGMGRVFQGAATVDSVLRGDLIERAADAGLRSLFVGFETLSDANLSSTNKPHNLGRDYAAAVRRLDDLGVMVNGSFVFGLDDDTPDVFDRTVDWAADAGLVTATFHVATPYPGTKFFERIEGEGRLLTRDWSRYDTRQAVFRPKGMTPRQLEDGYWRAYRRFYEWPMILRAANRPGRSLKHKAKHVAYAGGWKRLEPMWNLAIRGRRVGWLRPALRGVLSRVGRREHAVRSSSQLPVLDA